MAGERTEPVNHWEDCEEELARSGGREADTPAGGAVVDLIPASIRERAGAQSLDEFEDQVEALRQEGQRQEAEERMRIRIRNTIPKRYQSDDISLDSYKCEGREQQRIIDACRSYLRTFPERMDDGRGILLYGKPGTGKTHIACSVAKQVIRMGHSVTYTSVIEMMRKVKETYRQDSVRTEGQVVKSFIEPDLLVLEEVGVQHHTEAERVKMFEVIDGRYNEDKPFILVSNLGNQKLPECLSEKVWDRVQERCAAFAFTWDSYRTRRRHG